MKLDLVIVDDSPIWLSIAKKLAEQHPLVKKVTTFSDSIDAWIHLQKCRPDAVMTDIEMPGMNGLAFIYMFGSKLPFISSSTKKRYAIDANDLGCDNFITKPFTKSDFDRAILNLHKTLDRGTLTFNAKDVWMKPKSGKQNLSKI